jgi:ABC-type antimicrobial peptide transport system permease subunit
MLSDYLQDFFFENVLVGIVGFLGGIYVCFVGVWNWVSTFVISL